MTVGVRIQDRRDELTAAERKLAEVVLADPQTVAFGTVASFARAAGTSGASVVRFANHLEYDGFIELQAAVQEELADHLRPAVERIRQPAHDDIVGRTLAVEVDNVVASLEAIDRRVLAAAVTRLAAPRARVIVLPGSASFGVGYHLADQLGLLRDGVALAWGAPAPVTAALAALKRTDVVVAIDVRRYDVTVLDGAALSTKRGVPLIAITDSTLSPLARRAIATFTIAGEGAGPFDSQTGAMAVANTLVTAVAQRLRASATRRLDRVEQAWRAAGVLTDS
jgi:DNA-binding MurR/RpiR family transcriptional regulator